MSSDASGGGDYQRQITMEVVLTQKFSSLDSLIASDRYSFKTKLEQARLYIAKLPYDVRPYASICVICKKWAKDAQRGKACKCKSKKLHNYVDYLQWLYERKRALMIHKTQMKDRVQASVTISKTLRAMQNTILQRLLNRISDTVKMGNIGFKQWESDDLYEIDTTSNGDG